MFSSTNLLYHCIYISELIDTSREYSEKKFSGFNRGEKWHCDDKHEGIHSEEKSCRYNKSENSFCVMKTLFSIRKFKFGVTI
jgi:hypothetical protein